MKRSTSSPGLFQTVNAVLSIQMLLTIPLSILAICVVDNGQAPWSHILAGGPRITPLFQSLSMLIACAETLYFDLIALQLVMLGLFYLRERNRLTRVVLAGVAVVAALMSLSIYSTLTTYPKFQGYPPFIAGAICLAIYLTAVGFFRVLRSSAGKQFLLIGAALVGFGLFGLCSYLNYTQFQNYYPSLHQALGGTALVGIQSGLICALFILPIRQRGSRPGMGATGVITALFVCISMLDFIYPVPNKLIPAIAANTLLGDQTHRMRAAVPTRSAQGGYKEPACTQQPEPLLDRESLDLFQRHGHMPALPEDFKLGQWNVLLLTVETLRFDQTSLANPDLQTTPTLLALKNGGAYSFSNALSPANGTLQSIASLLSMTFPSFAPTSVDVPDWCGVLGDQAQTVPELFAETGYATFQVVYFGSVTEETCFRGFHQGFRERHTKKDLIDGDELLPTIDEKTAARAIAMLDDLATRPSRFFGWVFFLAPHDPYSPRRPGTFSALEAYRQEIAYTDRQIEKILAALRRNGLYDNTIVIVLGDHGEEFGDHGGVKHNSTLYKEQIHVPLLISIPTVKGEKVTQTTSTMYVFPWLLLNGPDTLRRAAVERIREDIAPAMKATDGSVISEFIATRGMGISLYHQFTKMNLHLNFGFFELFDLKTDPKELRNISQLQPPAMLPMAWRMKNYTELRACKRKFTTVDNPSPTLFVSEAGK
jgi:arylsulfatase A-like enzyme